MAPHIQLHPVLVVDPDKTICDTLTELLELEGYPAQEAQTPDEALARLHAVDECLVVIFGNFGPKDSPGLAFFSDLATDPELARLHTYVYLTTTPELMPAELVDLLHRLDVPILTKPFELEPFLRTVESAAEECPDDDERSA